MNWLARIFVFMVALFVGTASASLGLLFSEPTNVTDHSEGVSWTETGSTSALSPSGITVAYAGLHRESDGTLYVKFVAHNGLYQPVTYGAHHAEGPFATLKSNGDELPGLGRCGTGIQTFYILPGRSAEFHVSAYEFSKGPKKNDRISAGFYLKPALSDEYGPYYSEPFFLPEEFRRLIEDRN